jgi:hypothetical protein
MRCQSPVRDFGPFSGTRAVLILANALGIIAVSALPAQAYIDAGTGSVVLQALLAGLGGLLILARVFWSRLIRRKKKPGGPI